jgi:uncharacterized membrane protein
LFLEEELMSSKQVLVLTRLAMGMALSYLGSLINIPLVISTLSLDSLPGYTYALLFSGWEGALVAAFGHLLSALLRGFPFSLPVHIIIMAGMALAAWVLAWLTRRVKPIWAALGALLINASFANTNLGSSFLYWRSYTPYIGIST